MLNSNFVIHPDDRSEEFLKVLNRNKDVLKAIGEIPNCNWCINSGEIEFCDAFFGELYPFFVETCIVLASSMPSVGFSAEGDYSIPSRDYSEYCEAKYTGGVLNIQTEIDDYKETFAVRINDSNQSPADTGSLELTVLGDQSYKQELKTIVNSNQYISSLLTVDGNTVSLNYPLPLYHTIMARVFNSLCMGIARGIPDCAFTAEWHVGNLIENHTDSGFIDYFDYFLQSRSITDNFHKLGKCSRCGSTVFDAKNATDKRYICKNCSSYVGLGCDSFSEYIQDMAPAGYRASESHVTVPYGITRIPKNAYKDCTSLEIVTLPESLSIIGDNAFSGCTSLKELIIPDSVLVLGKDFCYGCTSLEKIRFSASGWVTGCSKCTSLKEVEIPDGVVEIEMSALYGCSALESVLLPESVKLIGGFAFDRTGITQIRIPPETQMWDDTRPSFPIECILHVLKGSAADKYAKKLKYHVKRYKDS